MCPGYWALTVFIVIVGIVGIVVLASHMRWVCDDQDSFRMRRRPSPLTAVRFSDPVRPSSLGFVREQTTNRPTFHASPDLAGFWEWSSSPPSHSSRSTLTNGTYTKYDLRDARKLERAFLEKETRLQVRITFPCAVVPCSSAVRQ